MWRCPKCGRAFKNTNQGHYCGETPKTVSDYIESQPFEARPHLNRLASIVRGCVPDAQECIAWSMPTYKKAGKAVSFSACKKHVSLYVGAEAIDRFSFELRDYQTKKSAVYFPYDKTLPIRLIETVVNRSLG